MTDEESDHWVRCLAGHGPGHDDAVDRLHRMLLRVCRSELARRSARTRIGGPELDDLAHQAADDATVKVVAKLELFRRQSRFTTWAYKFAVYEVSSTLGRHARRAYTERVDATDWENLPARLGDDPEEALIHQDLVRAVRAAVYEELSEHQRQVFLALVVEGQPLDMVAQARGTNRNALYKTMFDARRKIRHYLVTHHYLDPPAKEGP